VTLQEVKDGVASVEDLQALNALLDMQSDIEASQYEAAKAQR
jgi:hypothetical protein